MTAERVDPEGMGPATLRVTGWAWYRVDTLLVLVGTDSADPARRPMLADASRQPYFRLSELSRIVEQGDDDPWRVRLARELLDGVLADMAADPGWDRR